MTTNNRLNYRPTQHNIQIGAANGGLSNLSAGSIGQMLQGSTGSDPVYSTATYPSTASSSGKILRADGTNWVATTATYPDTAGTSGNVLKSDGTNWVSGTISGGTFLFVRVFTGDQTTPADATTYYMGNYSGGAWSTDATSASARILIPKNCTLKAVCAESFIGGTLGSTENVTLAVRINNTTDVTVSTTWKWNTQRNIVTNTGLSTSITAGDYIQFKLTTPTWATNPTLAFFGGSIYFG